MVAMATAVYIYTCIYTHNGVGSNPVEGRTKI
jgi:hypothetical protein